MKKKMMKAIKDLNAYIDDDRQKLCDELHEVKLSHKRMEKLLERTLKFFDIFYDPNSHWLDALLEVENLRPKIKQELANPYLRRNWGYTHKQEPGHYCDN